MEAAAVVIGFLMFLSVPPMAFGGGG